MENDKPNLVDVSRLYTLSKYSEVFGIPYATVYSKFNTSLSGRARNPLEIVKVSGTEMIFVSLEEEKRLKNKMKKKGVTV